MKWSSRIGSDTPHATEGMEKKRAEEEKARQLEEERKIKEETERRKREREEHTDKRPLSRAATAPKKVRYPSDIAFVWPDRRIERG